MEGESDGGDIAGGEKGKTYGRRLSRSPLHMRQISSVFCYALLEHNQNIKGEIYAVKAFRLETTQKKRR